MKFRRLLLSLFTLTAAVAQEPPDQAGAEGSWSVTPAFASQYLFRGARVAGASFQPSIDYAAGPLALGVWSSAAFSHRVAGDADPEFDFYGTYSFSNDAGTFDVAPGFWLYTYPDAERSDGYYALTFEPNLAVNLYLAGIRLTPMVYYDVTLEGATWELSAAFAVPLKSLGTTIEFLATAGTFKWDNVTAGASPKEKNWGDYYTIGARLPVTIGARSEVALGVTHSIGRNNFYKQGTDPKYENTDAGSHTAVTLSYTFSL